MHPNDQSQLRDFWLSCRLAASAWKRASGRYERYQELIEAHNAAAGLMGPGGLDDFQLKHIADSLAALKAFADLFGGPVRLADVGAGAGLPGIILAIALDQLHLVAIESNQRKADFIHLAADELDLAGRVQAIARRSRELGRGDEFAGRFDIVTARAVASAEKLIRDGRRLLAPGGSLILYKTPQTVADELPLAHREADKFDLTVETSDVVNLPADAGARQFIRIIAPS